MTMALPELDIDVIPEELQSNVDDIDDEVEEDEDLEDDEYVD